MDRLSSSSSSLGYALRLLSFTAGHCSALAGRHADASARALVQLQDAPGTCRRGCRPSEGLCVATSGPLELPPLGVR